MIRRKALLLTVMILIAFLCWECKQRNEVSVINNDALTIFKDTSFWQEYHEAFPLSKNRDNNIRSIAIDNESTVWIATSEGVFKKPKNSMDWVDAISKEEQGPSFSIEVDKQGSVWVSTWLSVYRWKNGELKQMPGATSPIAVLRRFQEGIYAIGPNGLWHYTKDGCEKIEYPIARSVRDASVNGDGSLWLGSDVGLYHCTVDTTHHYNKSNELVSAYVSSLEVGKADELWCGGLGGITIRDQRRVKRIITTKDGLPSAQVNCIRQSPDGTM